MDPNQTVRPGLLGILDAAIKYFDPSQSNISEEAKAKLEEAERNLQLQLSKIRNERNTLKEKLDKLEDSKARAEKEFMAIKMHYLKYSQVKSI